MTEKGYQWKDRISRNVWYIGLLGFGAILLLLLLEHYTPLSLERLGYECWVHKMTGLFCPGCGGTRSVLALFRGDIIHSFVYHPLVLYVVSIYAIYMIRGGVAILSRERYHFMKLRICYVYIGIAIILIQFFIKNIALLCFRIRWIA